MKIYHSFNIGMNVPLRIELKTKYIPKVSYFLHEILYISLYISPNDASDNGLFQLSGETSCLFKSSI